MLALVSVAFAANALGPGRHQGASDSPPISSSPTVDPVAGVGAPVLDPLDGPTRADATDVQGRLSTVLPEGGPFRVRVYVNGHFRGDTRVTPSTTAFTLAQVPLTAGTNTITATIGAGDSETTPSAPVTIERDVTPPALEISAPAPGTTLYGDTLLLKGTAEAGATVRLVNRTNGLSDSESAGDSGAFGLSLRLQLGNNVLVLQATDNVGNTTERDLTIERAVSQARITIELSRDSYELATLPQSISMSAHIVGPDGRPADGVVVTFSISPPGQPTVTRQVTAAGGTATWNAYPLTVAGAVAGSGLVTALATVSDGESVAGSAMFSYR